MARSSSLRVAGCFLVCTLGASLPGCAPEPQRSSQPPPPSGIVSGTMDVRPFQGVVAFAHWRANRRDVDIVLYERQVGADWGCSAQRLHMEDTERQLTVQMPWPAAPQTVWSSTLGTPNPNHAGIFFNVGRGLGSTGTRASGDARVLQSSPQGGVLFIEAGTSNEPGAVLGVVRGELPFTVCPG